MVFRIIEERMKNGKSKKKNVKKNRKRMNERKKNGLNEGNKIKGKTLKRKKGIS